MKVLKFLFGTTKGLILTAIAMISIVTAIWGTLSGPMVEWGVKDITVKILGMTLHPIERAGRIILLYHSIAMAVIAIEVYMITSLVPMKVRHKKTINTAVTVGYLLAMFGGLGFAYFGHNFILHGIFLVGQTLIFYAGSVLAVALWPWNKEFYVRDPQYAHTKKGVDLERMAFFFMTIATLGSAIFGAVTGSFWGNGHDTFLAEDLIREPHKEALQLSIIGHLHIMLTLVAVAITLIVGRWLDFKGFWHKLAMPFFIVGTIIITLGVWSVVPYEDTAHTIIYVGSGLILLGALFLVIYGFGKIIKDNLKAQGIEKAGFFRSLGALLSDPIKFGALWQMIYMNFVVTFVGIFMAIELENVMRVWPAREERITLTGHWHILAGIIATIILLYYADIVGLKGKIRKWFGWIVIIGSDLAFAGATIFSLKRLFLPELLQTKAVKIQMLMIDFGLGAVLVVLGLFMLWRLIDLFNKKGQWKKEMESPELEYPVTSKTDAVEG